MILLKYLSNEELVDHLYENIISPLLPKETLKLKEIGKEILRRLNEPWRAIKEGHND